MHLTREHEIALTNTLIELRLRRGLMVIFGDIGNDHVAKMKDLSPREFWMLMLVAACVLGMGLYPAPFTEVMHKSVDALLLHVSHSKL